MSVTYSAPSVHNVENLRASIMEFKEGCCLRLHFDDIDSMAIWFKGPHAKERVEAYAASINRTILADGDVSIGASA